METAATLVAENPLKPLLERYKRIRNQTEHICKPLAIEDYVVQPIVDISPPKWHLAHTTWFFENFLLAQYAPGYQIYSEDYNYLFNSYYESMGKRVLRPNRGNMTRPSVEQVYAYRERIDEAVAELLENETPLPEAAMQVLEIGLQHEQQHQELLVTDIKYILGHNPLFPAYHQTPIKYDVDTPEPLSMLPIEEGIYHIGYGGGSNFCFDNEQGQHKVYLHAFKAANRLVTNREYLAFMEAGGYSDHKWWYSDAWTWLQENNIKAPLYWHQTDNGWQHYTLNGLSDLNLNEPVIHLSQYEAAAFAAWAGKRLLTEQEWEVFANNYADNIQQGNFADSGLFHVKPDRPHGKQICGDAWEWTNSAYLPYPNYKQPEGALGEYNGKFMINQMVLRGGSCATPSDHFRLTYRNFFQPWHRWQYTGIRLAETI